MSKYIPKTITKEQAAYMAGIVDGEGSLCIGTYAKTKSGHPAWVVTLGVSNTSEALIDWLVERFGGAKLSYTPAQTAKNSRKRVYRWQCTGKRLRHICELIRPYSVIKPRQVEIILEILNSFQLRTYAKGNRGPQIAQKVIDGRYVLMNELRSLHAR